MNHDQNQKTVLEQVIVLLSALFVFLFLSGTKACQEDYELGSQSSGIATATPEDDEDDDTITATPTPTATPSATPTEEDEDGGDDDGEDDGGDDEEELEPDPDLAATELFSELAKLNNESSADQSSAESNSGGKSAGNWLGKAFEKSENTGPGLDSDGDGFADWLEKENGSDPLSVTSTPAVSIRTKLMNRFKGQDDDMDGLTNEEELKLKSDPGNPDSDGDGYFDGMEFHTDNDPLNSRSRPGDGDRDGACDDLEAEYNLDTSSDDTDKDGLKDSLELIIGSNPLDPDSDADGLLDGKEFSIGSDPTVRES